MHKLAQSNLARQLASNEAFMIKSRIQKWTLQRIIISPINSFVKLGGGVDDALV